MSTIPSTSTSHSNFVYIFNTALDTYKRKTKKDLASHPLLPRLQSCDSPEAILTVLREQISTSSQSQNGDDGLTKWVTPTVNVLYSFAAAVGEGVGLAFPPASIIFAGIGDLLSAAKDITGQDKLIDILNRIEQFFHRLEKYTSITPTMAMTDMIVGIMIEVLTILALATKEVKSGGLKKYVKKLTGNTDIEDSLERLDKMTQEEACMASAELLKVTLSADDRVRGVDGRVKDVTDDMHDIGNEDVDDRVQGIDSGANDISSERDLLYTHGYIARMLRTLQAPGYFTHLLRFDERNFQLVVSDGAFLLLHPAVQNVRPVTCIGSRLAWLLDYMLRDVGTVVPQRLWSPSSASDTQRYGTVWLNMPIFFIQRDRSTLGLPLNQARSGDCSALLNARLQAPVGHIHTAFIRIMWPGYTEWSSQIMIRDQTPEHNAIPIEALAARVARTVCRFLQDCVGQHSMSPAWFIGQGGITANDIILVGLIQVTQGSWQPILQLDRYIF